LFSRIFSLQPEAVSLPASVMLRPSLAFSTIIAPATFQSPMSYSQDLQVTIFRSFRNFLFTFSLMLCR
jgi:hypothetical protein